MCKKFKFDHTKKWYMHNPATVLENDTYKLLWDFNIKKGSPNPDQKTRTYNNQQQKKKKRKKEKKRELAKLSSLLSRWTTE